MAYFYLQLPGIDPTNDAGALAPNEASQGLVETDPDVLARFAASQANAQLTPRANIASDPVLPPDSDVMARYRAWRNAYDPSGIFPDWSPAYPEQMRSFMTTFPEIGTLASAPNSFPQTDAQNLGAMAPATDPDVLARFRMWQAQNDPQPVISNLHSHSDLRIASSTAENSPDAFGERDTSNVAGTAPRANEGVPVKLPTTGEAIKDEYSPTGILMSPADPSVVAAAGREAGLTFQRLSTNPETALAYLVSNLWQNVAQGGTFDYQRARNSTSGYTQLPQFRNIANFNVGLYCQQMGLTLEETLRIAGGYASLNSSNANANEPYGLDRRTAGFIKEGYRAGESGAYGPAARP
jgi:hypothetical protein